MDKRDKIVKGLEKCLERGFDCGINGNECPYYDLKSNSSGNGDCIDNLMSDTLALLKEDERAIKHQSDHLDALLKAQGASDDWISRKRLKEEIQYYIAEAEWGETVNTVLGWCLEFVDNQTAVKWD